MACAADRWRATERVAYEALEDETIVLDLQEGIYYRLNSVAANAWEGLSKGIVLDQVTDRLLRSYDVEARTLTRDLEELVCDFERLGLLCRMP